MKKKYDTIEPGRHVPMHMECAAIGKVHMHVYFENGVRIGCRFWDDESGRLLDPIKDMWEAGNMWSESHWRDTISLQKFVSSMLGR